MNQEQGVDYAIRLAKPAEIGWIREIEDAAGMLFLGLDIVDEAKWVSFSLDEIYRLANLGQVWFACFNDQPVGIVVASVRDGLAYIEELHVVPLHGRRGLGGQLLERACEWAQEQGYPAITLSTFRDIPWNGPFYRKHGFHDLESEEWTADMHAIRKAEGSLGLQIDKRVFMRRKLASVTNILE